MNIRRESMIIKFPINLQYSRIFLISVCLFSFGTAFQASEIDPTRETGRPNFIHIMVDDMSADAMGFCDRFDFMKTPHMDTMAASGIVFNKFFVTTSLCSPSRASILTGRYGHGTGVPDNSVESDPDPRLPTYPGLLQEAGYVTAHIGKWHMGHGDHPRPGFSHWYGFDGQGVYFDPVMNRNGKQEQIKGYLTDIITDEAIAFMRENKDQPFLLNLWHKAAHGPFLPPPRHEGFLDDVDYPKPVSWDDDLRNKPSWRRRNRAFGGAHLNYWLASEGKPIPDTAPVPPFTYEATLESRNHLSTLFAVDDSLGRIMATLDELGLLDNTVVIFTADNGFFLGEYARGDKRLADDVSMRVPMILHYPALKRGGETIDAIGLNIDFAPTFLDWAGVEMPESIQGSSLVPLLEGKVANLRDQFLYEYFQEEYAPGFPTILALRTERWKYVHHPYDPAAHDELFDLKTDPHEQYSLHGKAEFADQLERLKGSMEQEMERLEYKRPAYHFDPANYTGKNP